MIDIIKILNDKPYYGGGEFIEIAKGKHKQVLTISEALEKIKRVWLLKRK